MISKIKEFFKKKPFKKIVLEIHMIDGSVEMTDPVSYSKFKELITRRIMGEELRVATEEDFIEAYEVFQYTLNNPCEVDFFSVTLKGKTVELSSKEVLKIIQHKKG